MLLLLSPRVPARTRLFGAASLGCLALAPAAGAINVGLNLAGNAYFTEEVFFEDVSGHFKEYHAQKIGAPYREFDPGQVRFADTGLPSFLGPDHQATTLWDIPRGFAGGAYEVSWDGPGVVTWSKGSEVVASSANRLVLDLPTPPDEATRRILGIRGGDTSRAAENPVSNLRVTPVGGGGGGTFRQPFLDRWDGFAGFRYMDWTQTNNSDVARWEQRPVPGDATQAERGLGVALEFQIEHANTTGTNPWFNIPHLADDDYVRQAATLIRDNLDRGSVARVEYSNEVWNFGFEQQAYAAEQGDTTGGTNPRPLNDAMRFYAQRSAEVFEIFGDVFTDGGQNPDGLDRLVRVLGVQAANLGTARTVLSNPAAVAQADALAIAPYFGRGVGFENAEAFKNGTWEQRIDLVERELQNAFANIDAYAALLAETHADGTPRYGDLALFAYEGGQHLIDPNAGNQALEDAELTALMHELNRRDEMEDLYLRYLEHWEQAGGEDFYLFSSMSESSRFGSWGLLEHEGQALADAPKLRGVLRFLEGQSNPVPEPVGALALLAGATLLGRRRRG